MIVAVSQDVNGKAAYIKIQTVSNLKAVTFDRFAKQYIVASSRIGSDNCHALKKGLAQKYFVHYQTFFLEKEIGQSAHRDIQYERNAKRDISRCDKEQTTGVPRRILFQIT